MDDLHCGNEGLDVLRDFETVLHHATRCADRTVSVAVAEDRDVLEAVWEAARRGFMIPLLVGDRKKIESILESMGCRWNPEIVHEPDPMCAVFKSVELVHSGNAQVLMKGAVNTSDIMHAVLHKTEGLRSGKLLSHLAAFEVPGWKRLLFITDGGINITPDLEAKRHILENALITLAVMGYSTPKVAVLAANERVNPQAQATVDAEALVKIWQRGELPSPCVVEGPIALDVALSAKSAVHKHLQSTVSGKVDLFLVPSIEVGNVLGKALVYFAGARVAGLVLGASAPIILTSRSESVESKLCSIGLACMASIK